jgi:hypothetical protein
MPILDTGRRREENQEDQASKNAMGKPVSNTLDRASKSQWNSGLSVNRSTKYSKEKERKNKYIFFILDNELGIPTIFKFHLSYLLTWIAISHALNIQISLKSRRWEKKTSGKEHVDTRFKSSVS